MSEGWTLCTERLPIMERVVWLFEPGRGMWIGGRTEEVDGWLWANCYSTMWWNGQLWDADMETDSDYNPTHWMPLPEPPTLEAK